MSERHAWRLLAAYRRAGAAALAHGNRGRKPRNTVSDDEAKAVVELASTIYAGANHSHFTELLREREGIDLSRPTVRRILTRASISSPRHRRPPKHGVRRQRMPQPGMLVQIDGSFHRWLGDDGPQFTLLLAVDHATSAVVNAVFSPEEDTRSYFTLMQGLIERWGRPSRSTATATACSSFRASPGTSSPRWRPPTSAKPSPNWASSRSSPVLHRPRAGWNAPPEPSRTG